MDKFTNSRFNLAPTIKKARSRFDLSHPIRTTCNTGDFIPTNWEEVYPGETFSFKTNNFIRLETSLHQTMDNAYFETAHFYVKLKDIWNDFDKFFGYNEDPWARSTEVEVPQILIYGCVVEPQSILNQLGIPAGDYTDLDEDNAISVTALPLRALFEIWNQYYRDENYDTIIAYSKDSNDIKATDTFAFNGGQLSLIKYASATTFLRVNRYHDLFSSVLPAPQKGDAVALPLGISAPLTSSTAPLIGTVNISQNGPLALRNQYSDTGNLETLNRVDGYTMSLGVVADSSDMFGANDTLYYNGGLAGTLSGNANLSGVKVDLTGASSATVNQLRLAIATQAIKERDARTGTRMVERLYSIWSVEAPALELDRPEFLGGKRIPITMMEVLQTSETGTTVLGTDAGHSKTYGEDGGFVKSFVEYGIIISLAYLRTARSYSQGINKKFFKKSVYDFYDPMLDNIGEVDVKEKEINAVGFDDIEDLDAPVGYQEPWYHLKEGLAHDAGFFQAGINGTLDSWHYGDDYAPGQAVVINSGWLKETPAQVDRTIAVESNSGFQWSINMYLEIYATRMMRRYNIPNTFGFGSN